MLGCCVEEEEKMLIYEYMPNKSLDAPRKAQAYEWQKRFIVIEGVCRGLLYLHRDSRLKIIHRDLKASNILLDKDLNPKISDLVWLEFLGVTKIKPVHKGSSEHKYAMEGHFSEKSDVFSFGAWKLWNEGNVVSLIDPPISAAHFHGEIVRCMQVGLLCVQEFAKDRPSISIVISMLVRDIKDLPDPKPPGFSKRQITGATQITEQTSSTNYVTVTCLTGR
ncbi:hypothetical protein RDABS01_037741 [Bienertia sinuspersici]